MGIQQFLSPAGNIVIKSGENGLLSIKFSELTAGESPDELTNITVNYLKSYFSGEHPVFDLPLDMQLSDFQKSVLNIVKEIPYGKVMSYGDIARKLGDAGKVRAVGAANGANPFLIAVPCHRVIGADGELTGYAGGLDKKKWLLEHEGVITQMSLF